MYSENEDCALMNSQVQSNLSKFRRKHLNETSEIRKEGFDKLLLFSLVLQVNKYFGGEKNHADKRTFYFK